MSSKFHIHNKAGMQMLSVHASSMNVANIVEFKLLTIEFNNNF